MFDDWKIIFGLALTAVLSAIVRFTTFSQLCFDAVLGFVMGYSFYGLLDYFSLSGETRSGIAGMVILCSRPLYETLNKMIMTKLGEILEKRIDK